MLQRGRGLAQLKDAVIYIGGTILFTRHIGVYMHWVILGMELDYQALRTRQQLLNNS